jgi:cell division protein FtsI/penicillin-binding protein 2
MGLCVLAAVGLATRQALLIYRAEVPVTDSDRERAEELESLKRGQRITMSLDARPGNILARSRHTHVALATSRQQPGCYIDPKNVPMDKMSAVAIQLAKILHMDPNEVFDTINNRKDDRFVWVRRPITDTQATQIRQACSADARKGDTPSVLRHNFLGILYEWKREYPNDTLASTVVGYVQKNGDPGGGLELAAKSTLQAKPGVRVVQADAARRPFVAMLKDSRRSVNGNNVRLSLDVVIQSTLERAVAGAVEKYGAEWGTGVVMDPQTGDILAMCSAPNFNPNQYTETGPESKLNRAICLAYEPGSIFKPIIAAAAVNDRTVNYDTMFATGNGIYVARRGGRISDHGHSYGTIPLRMVIIKSSNVGMAKLGEKIGNERLYSMLKEWGFGKKTGVGLGGETWGQVRAFSAWNGYTLRRIPFGQEMSANALQLTRAFCAFANGGLLMQPRLIQSITDENGAVVEAFRPKAIRRVLSAKVAAQTLKVLASVVTDGTGKAARLDGYTSFGKTGTAQVSNQHGYIDGAYTGSFIGGAPVKKPRLICLVSIHRPDRSKGYYGGTVAAPAVRRVLQETLEYLNVPQDKPSATRGGASR